MKHIILSTFAASSLFFTSCGGKKAETGVNKDNLKPVEAVENWQKDYEEGRLASLWDSLTEEYQNDLTQLAHQFGEKVDAEVYNEAMSSLSAASSLLKNKKGMILELLKENAPEGNTEQLALIEKNYDSIVGIVHTLATSDAKDVEGMKQLKVGELLGDLQKHTKELASMAALAEDNLNKIKDAKVSLISESGDTAEVKVVIGEKTNNLKLVKKDDRWIPVDLTEKWPEMMADAAKGINQMDAMRPTDKQQVIMMLGMVKSSIKSLESAKTKEEMMQKMQGLMGLVSGQ